MLYCISIGTDKSGLTAAAEKLLSSVDYRVFRTTKIKAAKKLVCDFSFDTLYETCADFDELKNKAADKLSELAETYKNVAYVTDDAVDDVICRALYDRGVKFEMSGLGICPPVPVSAYLKLSAYELGADPYLDTGVATFVYSLDNACVAASVKLFLMRFYDYSTPVIFSVGGKNREITLEDIDRQTGYDYSTSVFVPAITNFNKKKSGFGDLLRIISRLTAPDGCPWDKAQTHESIRPNMLEEAYEAVDAVNKKDISGMIEEFGDVILQSVLNCDIADRSGEFDISDVLSALCAKLFNRHTHIFGSDHALDANEALNYWDKAKAKEKNYLSLADQIDRIPECFSAVMKMQKMLSKAIKAGLYTGDALENLRKILYEDKPDIPLVLENVVLLCKQCELDAETEMTAAAQNIKDKLLAEEAFKKDEKR